MRDAARDVPAGSPTAAYALAICALLAGDDAAAQARARAMREGAEPFARTADAIDGARAARRCQLRRTPWGRSWRTSRERSEHLTGVAIADTALMMERLAARRGMSAHLSSPLCRSLARRSIARERGRVQCPKRGVRRHFAAPSLCVYAVVVLYYSSEDAGSVDGSDNEIEQQVRRFGQRLRVCRTQGRSLAARAGQARGSRPRRGELPRARQARAQPQHARARRARRRREPRRVARRRSAAPAKRLSRAGDGDPLVLFGANLRRVRHGAGHVPGGARARCAASTAPRSRSSSAARERRTCARSSSSRGRSRCHPRSLLEGID